MSSPRLGHEIAPARPDAIDVVPNGIDPGEFVPLTPRDRADARARLGLRDPDFVVGFLGEYSTTRKGLEALLQAVALGPDDEYLVIAGRGDDRRLADRVRRLGMGERVRVLGFEPPRLVLAASDLLAVPSHYEPWSLVGLEAAASGVPVLISACAGVVPHLGPAVATVERPADIADLRCAITQLRSDPSRRARMAAEGIARARELTWERAAAEAALVIEQTARTRLAAGRG